MADNVVKLRPGKIPHVTAEKLELQIATSSGHLGKVANKKTTWLTLCERLSTPLVDNVTTKEFKSKSIAWQHKRKNQGYFVGGQFKSGARKLHNLSHRCVLTFDIDNCSPGLMFDIEAGMTALAKFEYFYYTTRSHTPEHPRVRLIVPLVTPIDVNKLSPLSRIMAEQLDTAMSTVDPVSFRPAQVMYWPNINSDGEFLKGRNSGILMDGERELEAWGDWTDYSKLPRSDREKPLRAAGDKAQDPFVKRGIVGAFCRAHTISSAIETFLSDIYELGEGGTEGSPRYSYLPGSTRNGAVMYDDDRFLYSNHGTDPVADMLVNAYDMVRIHKYSHLDIVSEDGTDDADPTSMKSYKAMAEWAAELPEVQRELRDDQYDMDAIEADMPTDEEEDEEQAALTQETQDFGIEEDEGGAVIVKPEVTSTEQDPDWKEKLAVTEKGIIRCTIHNLVLILDNDPRFRGRLGYNEFLQEAVIIRQIKSKQWGHDTGPIRNIENGDYISQNVEIVIRCILEAPRGDGKSGWGLRVSDRDLKDAIHRSASAHTFHPIKSYIRACKWDGKPRVRQFLNEHARAAKTAYHEAVSYNLLVGGVARVFEPGCKFDFVTILEGIQGIGKSTLIQTLVGPSRFAEMQGDFDDKAKLVEQIQGKWFIEIPELAQFNRSDTETLKAIFSAQKDRVRLAWGRGAKDYFRQCIFMGTTNRKIYLKDDENRRYWPVKLPPTPINLWKLRQDRDQIWAEAYQHYLSERRIKPDLTEPLPLYMQGDVADAQREQTQSRTEVTSEDSTKGQVIAWLDTPVAESAAEPGYRGDIIEDLDGEDVVMRQETCLKDIAFYVLGKLDNETDHRLSLSLGRIMADLPNWERNRIKVRLRGPLGPQWTFRRLTEQ